MYYEFTWNGQHVLKRGTFDPAIAICFNNNNTPTSLKQLSAYTSHKTLGVYKNLDGNTTAAVRVLKEKNAIHTKTTSRSPLTHTDAWAYYHAIYLLSIVYPFPSGCLQRDQCQHLQKQVKQAILPKCGYNRNTPNVIVYRPSEYGGIEMKSYIARVMSKEQMEFEHCKSYRTPYRQAALISARTSPHSTYPIYVT